MSEPDMDETWDEHDLPENEGLDSETCEDCGQHFDNCGCLGDD